MRVTKSHLAVLLALLALALASAACGDDDDSDGTPTPAPTATPADESPAPTPTATEDGADTPDPDGNGDRPLSDLRNLLDSYEEWTGAVSYSVTDDTGSENTWTIYSDPPNRRIDIDTGTNVISSYTTPEQSFYCTSVDESCTDAGMFSPARLFFAAFDIFVSYQSLVTYTEGLGAIETSTQEIAGVQTTCYSAEGTIAEESGSVTWCFSDGGLLLLSQYDLATTSWEMRATDVQEQPPQDAFDPPYPIDA